MAMNSRGAPLGALSAVALVLSLSSAAYAVPIVIDFDPTPVTTNIRTSGSSGSRRCFPPTELRLRRLRAGIFGCDHVLFGTDCRFDPEGGPLFIRDIIKVLDEIDITADERRKIYQPNAERLLKLKA